MHESIVQQLRDIRAHQGHKPLITPDELRQVIPGTDTQGLQVLNYRTMISEIQAGDVSRIAQGKKPRKLFFGHGCSVHNYDETMRLLDYEAKTVEQIGTDNLIYVARLCFEKPRTTTGWKGLMRDPEMDGMDNTSLGLYLSRRILLEALDRNIATSFEILGDRSIQYLDEVLCFGWVGARTCESQPQREISSGLSIPMAFKNPTSGDLDILVQTIEAVIHKHTFVGMDNAGLIWQYHTDGNNDVSCLLRGGNMTHERSMLEKTMHRISQLAKQDNLDTNYSSEIGQIHTELLQLKESLGGPNYSEEYVSRLLTKLTAKGLPSSIIIDCSHGNSSKDYRNQPGVAKNVIRQIVNGNENIIGIMVEAYHHAGKQNLPLELKPWTKERLLKNYSVTDACISKETERRLVLYMNDKLVNR